MGTWSVSPVQRATEPCSAFLPSFRRTPPAPQPRRRRPATAAQPQPGTTARGRKTAVTWRNPQFRRQRRRAGRSVRPPQPWTWPQPQPQSESAVQAVPCGRRRPRPRISPFSGPVRPCGRFSARAWVFGRFGTFDDSESLLTAHKSAPRRSRHKSVEPAQFSEPASAVGQRSSPSRRGRRSVPAGRPVRPSAQHAQPRFSAQFSARFRVSWFVPVYAGHSVSTPEWLSLIHI